MNQTLFIESYNDARKILAYDTATGKTVVQKRRKDFAEDRFAPGFFIIHDRKIIAVIPSPIGPLLLIGDECYSLVQQTIDIELGDEEEGHINTFAVFLDKTEIYRTEYERPYSDYDAFSDPESVDFFFWMANGFQEPQFIHFHTQEGSYEGLDKHLSTLPQPPEAEHSESELPEPELPESDLADIPIAEIMNGEPLPPFIYPWPVHLMVLLLLILWISSLKPALPYIPAAIALKKGEVLLARGEYDEAIDQLRLALKKIPSTRHAKILLARGYFSNTDPNDDELGLDVLSGLSFYGVEWDKINDVLPKGYRQYFTEQK